MDNRKITSQWISIFLVTFLASYLFIFNEWLFAITKPSFISDMGFLQQVQIFLTVSGLFTSLCFVVLLIPLFINMIPGVKRYTNIHVKIGILLPAIIFATLILMMLDNFTYTIFKIGIVSTESWLRVLCGFGFLVLIFKTYRTILSKLEGVWLMKKFWFFSRKWTIILPSIIFLSLSGLIFSNQTFISSSFLPNTTEPQSYPNIILITADGLDANHMSVYGYDRDTTPNLRELVESSLVAMNNFSNTEHTTGSIYSIYTGKFPTQTNLFWYPNILQGNDSYEHLPGILKAHGYRSVQITIPDFLDAHRYNFLDGFDEVKISSATHSKYLNTILRLTPRDKALFIDEISKRVIDRIRHIFLIQKMTNPYLLVTTMPVLRVDAERWEILKQEVQPSKQPVFIHIHLMVTHGKTYNPVEQKFSYGQLINDQEPWNIDFYDDSILEFDRNLGDFIDYLRHSRQLDNTILIITSDHGHRVDKQTKRIPLIFRFPYGENTGIIHENVQNLDIAPTILDFLGMDQPEWMSGTSLIFEKLVQRPIFGVSVYKENETSDITVNGQKIASPFGELSFITLIYCQKWYKMDLTTLNWENGEVDRSTSVCSVNDMITDEQAYEWMIDHIKKAGLDVSILYNLSPWTD